VSNLQYRNDLLEALNDQHNRAEKMYLDICDALDQAILYYDFTTSNIVTLGDWNAICDFEITTNKDILQLLSLIDEEGVPALKEALFLEKTCKRQERMIYKLSDQDKYLEFHVSVVYTDDGELESKIIKIQDVTKSQTQSDKLEYLAYYDALTGLYNRNFFINTLGDWIKESEEDQSVISVLIFDIDNFRIINDCNGMVVGDEIITSFGKILSTYNCENNVIVSRFHADIFYIAIKDPCGRTNIEHVTSDVFRKVINPIKLSDGKDVTISISIGVTSFPEDTDNIIDLLKYAEITMYKARESGKNKHVYFNQTILEAFLYREEAEQMLREADVESEFYLNFQPQFNTITKKLRGVEALLRWKNIKGNIISPSVFIPMAEKSGKIVSLGAWVIEKSIKTYMEWSKKYTYPMILSINISAVQLYRGDLIVDLMNIIKKYNMDPSLLEIEITESVLIHDIATMTTKMNILRSMGIKVSMDDFGTGYSSLAYLSGLPIDTLKIDKSFIDSVMINDRTKIIIEAIIKTVNQLGLETVAEGVETKEQLEFLQKMNCDCIQGFLLGKPMQANEIEELIMKEL
jgi:diguanylate cyclase (GGDEF)-like protein